MQNQNQVIAQEAQLLLEEKWVIETVKKIRSQRNSLQIERLHLESLKYNLMNKYIKKPEDPNAKLNQIVEQNTTTALQTMTNIRNNQNSDMEVVPGVMEQHCNEEQLDLAVTKSVFNQDYTSDMNMEEYEDDEDTCDNIVIDINMLMNS